MKGRILPGMLNKKIKEVPLRHKGKKAAVSRQMREIRDDRALAADLACKLAYFLVRAFEKFVQNAEFMHDFESGWMNCVPRNRAESHRVSPEQLPPRPCGPTKSEASCRRDRLQLYSSGCGEFQPWFYLRRRMVERCLRNGFRKLWRFRHFSSGV